MPREDQTAEIEKRMNTYLKGMKKDLRQKTKDKKTVTLWRMLQCSCTIKLILS